MRRDFAALLKTVAGEGREKGKPLAEERWLRKGEIQQDRIGR